MNNNLEIKRSEVIYHGLMSSRIKYMLRAFANQITSDYFNLEIVIFTLQSTLFLMRRQRGSNE